MAATAVPSGRSLLGKVAVSAAARAAGKRRASKLAAVMGDHVTTFAALAAADVGLWHVGDVAGWLGLAAGLLIAEFKVRG